MRTRVPALILSMGILLIGCAEDTPYVPELRNNEISRSWHGVYVGLGSFDRPSERVSELPVQVRLELQDLGENQIMVKLNLTPSYYYSPRLWLDVPVLSVYSTQYSVQFEMTTFNVAMIHHVDDDRVEGSMSAVGLGESGATWSVGFQVYEEVPPDDPGDKPTG